MSKRESISRYSLIIKKLRKHPATFSQIADYLNYESELQGYNFNVSKRTFQRDVEDIYVIYKIDIQYDFSARHYYIADEENPEVNERILEAFDMFNALNIRDRISDYIHFEKRPPQGTENLYGLLHAIRMKVQIRFTYQKFWDELATQRKTEPYLVKEFKNRWYLLAKDLKDSRLKTFALDRMSELEITKITFAPSNDFDVHRYFRNSFGVIASENDVPHEVILSFDPFQGKYIKSLPLHETQSILKDDKDELLIRMNIFLTHDFLMEILSYGESVKVVKPDILRKKVMQSLQNTLLQYESESTSQY